MAKSLNKNLHSARTAKTDEFYAHLADIEKLAKAFGVKLGKLL